MNNLGKTILFIVGLLLVSWLLYTFRTIVVYLIVAIIVSFLGRPLVTLFKKIKVGKKGMSRAMAAILSMIALISIIGIMCWILVPPFVNQLENLTEVDTEMVSSALEEPISKLEIWAEKYGFFMRDEMQDEFNNKLVQYFEFSNVTASLEGLIGTLSSFVIGLFSVIFLSFFFLKDSYLFDKIIYSVTPDIHYEKVNNAVKSTISLLTRYFSGIVIQISAIILLVFLGLTILGVDNALLIAVFAGIFNIIPYLGPIIGISFGLTLGITSNLDLEFYAETVPLLGKMLLVFGIVQLLDNFVFQPLIFSNSVKAHPMEIFLVILMSATLGGIVGMVVAIPVYTILRVFAKEFLIRFKFVQSLTKNI
jgi:predicted PurR-regulated permease PerM